jgi:hypothetical protein
MATTGETAAGHAPTQPATISRRLDVLVADAAARAAARPWVLPVVAGVASLLARGLLVAHTGAMIDGDEAMVGLQAEGILRGQFPTYFYGQTYMGTLEAYLAAPLVALLGPTGWALRVVPMALSLLLVYLTWRLARAVLPTDHPLTPLLAGLAALVAALPPLYDAVAELRAWGGQIEIYVVTLAVLLCVVELADQLRAGASSGELARRWLVLGFFAGLGIWINPLISYALVAGALWLAPALAVRGAPALARRLRLNTEGAAHGHGAGDWLALVALVPGAVLGGLPAWLYAVRHSGENLLVFVTQPAVDPAVSGAARHGRLFLAAAITAHYAGCVAPSVLDGALPTESLKYLPVRLLLLVPPVLALACGVWLLWRRPTGYVRVGLPLLFAGVVTAVFCLGTSAWAASKSCSLDLAGRYAVPLGLVEPVLLLALVALPVLLAGRLGGRLTVGALLAALLVAGALQVTTYALASPTQTFQSPYYHRVPANTSQLLTYLSTHDIHAAWCNHWLGNIVTYQTDGHTVCADYYDQVYNHGIQRPPGTLQTVASAERASFILILTDPRPCLARELDAQGVAYTLAVLPQSGVTVITPAHTVNPALVVPGLGQDYTEQSLQGSVCSNAVISSRPASTANSRSNPRVSPGAMNSSRPLSRAAQRPSGRQLAGSVPTT